MQLANLSQPQCEILFLHWVVTERNVSPYLSPTERLTCPVLWCGINFDNHESLLCHLKDCPHLSASGYWCPRCHRAESFASNKILESIFGSDHRTPVQKKPSRLKKLLCNPFSRKRASNPSQDLIKKSNSISPELHSPRICEMDDQCVHYPPSGYRFELEATVTKPEQQRDTFGSSDTSTYNSAELYSWNLILELYNDRIMPAELAGVESFRSDDGGAMHPMQSQLTREVDLCEHEPIYTPLPETVSGQPDPQGNIGGHIPGNASSEFSQFNEQSNSVQYFLNLPPTFDQDIAELANGFEQVHSPEPALQGHISQLDGCNPASGKFDHQFKNFQTLRPTLPGYDPFHAPNLADVQTPCHPPADLDHAPRSTPSVYDLFHTLNLAHIDTINVPVGGQRVRPDYPNPETGPVNSPLSASSNQTNTSWFNALMVIVSTLVTPFSGAGSPTNLSPQNISTPSARSSGSPREDNSTCTECGIFIPDRSNLKRHKKNMHGKKSYTSCRADCGRRFSRRDNEARHYKEQIEKERNEGDTKRRKSRRSAHIHLAFAARIIREPVGPDSQPFEG